MTVRLVALVVAMAVATSAWAQPYYDNTRELNALRDAARAQEKHAESLRQIESLERDRARDLDRARRNASRDARSARRFD